MRSVLMMVFFMVGCTSPAPAKPDPTLLVEAPSSDEAEPLVDGASDESFDSMEASSDKSDSVKKRAFKIPAPLDHDTEGVVLPIPESVSYPSVHGFMEEYRDAYMKFMPLSSDYRVYFSAVTSDEGEEAREAVRVRVREDFERVHWVYLYGIQELMEYLASVSKGTLMVDREENFVARMKTITFMGAVLAEVSGETKYREYARDVYVVLSKRHFGRTVNSRSGQAKESRKVTTPSGSEAAQTK